MLCLFASLTLCAADLQTAALLEAAADLEKRREAWLFLLLLPAISFFLRLFLSFFLLLDSSLLRSPEMAYALLLSPEPPLALSRAQCLYRNSGSNQIKSKLVPSYRCVESLKLRLPLCIYFGLIDHHDHFQVQRITVT